jgi:hypothetical protein
MKNELREANFYKLAFKNNLRLTEVNGKVGFAGKLENRISFYHELEDYYIDVFWKNYALHSEDYDGEEKSVVENMAEFEYLTEDRLAYRLQDMADELGELIDEDYPLGGMIEPYDIWRDNKLTE